MITKENLKKRILSMAEDFYKTAEKSVDKLLDSDCLDLEGADDNLILPKAILTAILVQESTEYAPTKYDFNHKKTSAYKQFEKEVKNIQAHL